MAIKRKNGADAARIAVDVVEPTARVRHSWESCRIGDNIQFDTTRLETYFCAHWKPEVYDAMLVAAAVEFADRSKARRALTWERDIELRIPVHDPERWNDRPVRDALKDALDFLTGVPAPIFWTVQPL